MATTLVLFTVLLPLILGCVLAGVAFFTPAKAALLGLGTLIAILCVYVLLEGFPPLPPVSSKHKIFYIFGALGFATLATHKLRGAPLAALTVSLLLAALYWIGQRKINDDPFQPEIFLALLPVIGAGVSAAFPQKLREDIFVWQTALIAMGISGSLVSVLGGYIGLAQMLGALSALTGGYLAVGYVAVHVLGRTPASTKFAGLNWLLMVAISAVLISIALFASKLSAAAFAVVCLTYLTPFFAARLLGRGPWWAPFAMGGYSLVPALVAITFAWTQST